MNIQDKVDLGQYEINEENNQITLRDLRFYSYEDGTKFVPSVTTINQCYPKSEEFLKWLKETGSEADNIRDAAGTHGSHVHNLCERFLNNEIVSLIDLDGRIRYSSKEWSQFEKFVHFYRKFNLNVLHTEFNIISPNLGFAGTIDMLAELDGKTYILDIKTSNNIHNTYFLQLAAYTELFKEAYPETHIDGVGIIWLNAKTRTEGKTGTYQSKGVQLIFPPKELSSYWRLFRATHVLYLEEYGDLKPNNLTYNIEYKK